MPDPNDRAKAVFRRAVELDDANARAAFVANACANDRQLKARVNALLQKHADAIVEKKAVNPATSDFRSDEPASDRTADYHSGGVPGLVIGGRYKLVKRIGEGGMGAVWLAQQAKPVKRPVAIKLIKPGMDSKQVLARFEAERQALALMDHPNIAKVFDAGTTAAGRPYFVMELVKGQPITAYCDAHRLTLRQRLELFVPVCQAIQHAHQKGVIHRDIKPSNVLVAHYDDRPIPKVIDFGVAKATGALLTERTIETANGIVGTPQYMSPEQATLDNLDVDTRTDVYSLGVLLYELLTGTPPFTKRDLDKKGLLEILRAVREDEPPRPSTKLSYAEALPTLSAKRRTDPKKLAGMLRNEID
jgi:eukaryotic-like serine/threonine-protein kinase